MRKVPNKLIRDTKAILNLYLFLRYECGLKDADKLSAKELRVFLSAIEHPKKGLILSF